MNEVRLKKLTEQRLQPESHVLFSRRRLCGGHYYSLGLAAIPTCKTTVERYVERNASTENRAMSSAKSPTPVIFCSHGSTMMLGEDSAPGRYWESVGLEAKQRGIKGVIFMVSFNSGHTLSFANSNLGERERIGKSAERALRWPPMLPTLRSSQWLGLNPQNTRTTR